MKVLFAALALLIFAGVSLADTLNVTGTWDYQGTTLAGCDGCALSGQITLDALGNPTAWAFTDGTHTLDTSDSVLNLSRLVIAFPDFAGSPLLWRFEVFADNDTSGSRSIFSQFYGSAVESSDMAFGEFESGNEGVWTESVPTAEPGTLALIGVGLLGLLARKRFRVNTIKT